MPLLNFAQISNQNKLWLVITFISSVYIGLHQIKTNNKRRQIWFGQFCNVPNIHKILIFSKLDIFAAIVGLLNLGWLTQICQFYSVKFDQYRNYYIFSNSYFPEFCLSKEQCASPLRWWGFTTWIIQQVFYALAYFLPRATYAVLLAAATSYAFVRIASAMRG